MDTATGTPREGKGAQTRRAILDAATARFGRDGYRATKVADIARDASVGGTLVYAYFPNKEALFLAALDEDAAGVIHEALDHVLGEQGQGPREWQDTLVLNLVASLERYPLARRVLAGREPDVTERIIDIPAMEELRKAIAERLRRDQLDGLVRTDIDPVAIARGSVAIFVSLIMSVLQLGPAGATAFGDDVRAVFDAAIAIPPR